MCADFAKLKAFACIGACIAVAQSELEYEAGLREELDIFFGNKGFEWPGSQLSRKGRQNRVRRSQSFWRRRVTPVPAPQPPPLMTATQGMAAAAAVSARLLSAAATAAGKAAAEAAKGELADLKGSKVALVVAITIVAAELAIVAAEAP